MSTGTASSLASVRGVTKPTPSGGRDWPTELGALTGLTSSNCCEGGRGDLFVCECGRMVTILISKVVGDVNLTSLPSRPHKYTHHYPMLQN